MATNNNLKRVVLVTAAVAVAALGVAALIALASGGFSASGPFLGTAANVDQRKTMSLAGVDQLRIEGVSEDIHLKTIDGDSLDAWFHGSVRGGRMNAVPQMTVERNGSTVTVRIERKRAFSIGFIWSNLNLDVSLPASYAGGVSVSAVSATVDVQDRQFAGLALSTVSGDVKVGAVKSSDFSARTTSGSVRASSVQAATAELSTVSGDIDVASLTGATTVHTTSGDAKVAFASMPAAVDAGSTSGSVTLRFPQDAGFVLDAQSTSGDVKCAFPITVSQSSSGGGRHALSGVVGSGGAKVSVRTVSGDIHLTR